MVEQIIAPGSHANVEADDGFFFGVGTFETIAVSGRVPIFFDKHLARMGEALRFLGIKADAADLRALVLRACAELDPASEMALKLTITERNRIVSFRQNPYVAPGAKCAFRCDFSDVRRCETSHFTYMKTLAYAENIVEKRYAQERGIDEPLFLNADGLIAEGAVSNIFAVFGGETVTPPVTCGLLPGIMRQFVIEKMGAQEHPLTPVELLRADEIFVTNSLMGAMPVCSIGAAAFEPGPVSRRVRDAYGRLVMRMRAAGLEALSPTADSGFTQTCEERTKGEGAR